MEKIRVAFLGCGGIAAKHVRSLKANPDVKIVGCCDVTEDIVKGFIDRTMPEYKPRPPSFTDAAEMYKKTKANAVVICTPHTQHFEQGMQALDAGCHVLMEKPMVTSSEHAYKIKEKVDKTGKVFIVAYNTPCSPEFAYLRDQIRKGTFGKLEMVNGFISQDWLRLTVGKWRQDPALSGGGQAYDSGAHLLNSLCWSVESRPVEVYSIIDNHGSKVDINSVFVIRFENGVMASICISGNCPGGGSHMVFIFDNGRVEIDGWGAGWVNIFEGANKVKYPQITGKACEPAENFVDAILGRAEPRTSPMNGIIQSELMDAIYEAARTGKPFRAKKR
ncbi:MAG: hypothetical protein A3K19_19790 [Lentisphaerae bacterium RIFOXYB12_FULL_65_16]|nr:MAG: hypothetical protein A3K18_07560 [Lentisphaerae bacterium RIFOXYA12_64_32]OGV85050.1 MAG: hypothetical protein A3K19_19790 [Lentisphaerae bacterium RIFOXYB12_FULL_65_16]